MYWIVLHLFLNVCVLITMLYCQRFICSKVLMQDGTNFIKIYIWIRIMLNMQPLMCNLNSKYWKNLCTYWVGQLGLISFSSFFKILMHHKKVVCKTLMPQPFSDMWRVCLPFDLLTWISIGIIYSSRTIYLPRVKLQGQSILDLTVAQGLGVLPSTLTVRPEYQ